MYKSLSLIFVLLIGISNVNAADETQTRMGDAEAGKKKAETCAACHGVNGISVNPAWPNLAGQGQRYIVDQLKLFKDKIRINTMMNPQAEPLSEQDMLDIAEFYASQKANRGSADPDKEFATEKYYEIGERIYRGGNMATGVPACMSCHSPDGKGNEPAKFPQLAGQHAVYTAAQLRAYRSGARYQPDDNLNMMKEIAIGMSDTEIDAVSEYIAGLH